MSAGLANRFNLGILLSLASFVVSLIAERKRRLLGMGASSLILLCWVRYFLSHLSTLWTKS